MENKIIQEGTMKLNNKIITLNELYRIFFTKIDEIFKDMTTKILFCLACSDIITDYPIPQPPLKISNLGPAVQKLKIVQEKRVKF